MDEIPEETVSQSMLPMYICTDLLPLTIQEFEKRLNSKSRVAKLEVIKRPVYGLKFVKQVKNLESHGVNIAEFVQSQSTPIYREYYSLNINKECRLYIEPTESQDQLSVFTVCASRQKNLDWFINLVKM
jgi:hypothetical protein